MQVLQHLRHVYIETNIKKGHDCQKFPKRGDLNDDLSHTRCSWDKHVRAEEVKPF